MRWIGDWVVGVLVIGAWVGSAPGGEPFAFRAETIDPAVGKACAAVVATDVDGDGQIDVVALANDAVVWYQNPTWVKREIFRGPSNADNVCLQPHDVDGDGRVDFALGSVRRPSETGGSLVILTRTGAPEGIWRTIPIAAESNLHRVRWADLAGTGQPQLIVATAYGQAASTQSPSGLVGTSQTPARISAYTVPARPYQDPWRSRLISDRFHAVESIEVIDARPLLPAIKTSPSLLVGGWDGLFFVDPAAWEAESALKVGDSSFWAGGNGHNNQIVNEARVGRLRDRSTFVAAIYYHRSSLVAYHGVVQPESAAMARHDIDFGIEAAHGLWCADFDGDGDDELVVGQGAKNPRVPTDQGPGIRIYDPKPASNPLAFDRQWVDEGGIAVADLVAADLDGDGRPEIIAGGRDTHNVRIYWNQTKPRP